MTTSGSINVMPHPRILGVLGDIEFSHWQCLAELADNAFDEFREAGSGVDTPTVSISLPTANSHRSTAEITVRDNGRGMSLEAVSNAISAGWTSNSRHGALGLFGMGFNISTARLGRHTTVRTSQAGDPDWIEVVLDLPRLAESSEYEAPYRRVPKSDLAEHGTTVTISDLKSDQYDVLKRPNTHKVIRQKLGEVYSYLLAEKGFLLTVNNQAVVPRLPCVWDKSRTVTRQGVTIHAVQHIDQPLSEKKACSACGYWSSADAEVCEECESPRIELRERRIRGWIGIQRYVHKSDYGIDFLRNGRKILVKDKRVFEWRDEDELSEPETEYPIDDKTPMGRIVGEIHCDHVTPNYQKTAFEFETHEWRQVIRAVRGNSPLRPKIAKSLGLPENQSPLALLYTGFRRRDPGLNYLIPGDGNIALHEKAREWAERFRAGDPQYQTDEIWYQAAYQHDHPVGPEPSTDDTEILPGVGIDSIFNPEPLESGSGSESNPTAPAALVPDPAPPSLEETLDARLARYRDHGTHVVDLCGDYMLRELGSVTLEAWAVRGQRLLDEDREVPVFAKMLRAPKVEVFIDTEHPLFREHGSDIRDLALVELAEHMRVRADRTDLPLTEVVGKLKDGSSSPRLTPAAMADEAEHLLEQVRSAMAAVVAEDAAMHWEQLAEGERLAAQRRFALEAASTSWDDAIAKGDFIRYAPAGAVIRVLQGAPEAFLDGCVFMRSYGSLQDASARELALDRLISPLRDLALLEEHRPRLDPDELARFRASCRLISRDLVAQV
ncbi:ATP-binding protein [Streptomyces violascens]|uniref:ATP-binding protein n=1 Tax=Streptomyces violascens TaxID=67381 RepID=UPI003688827D